MPPGWCVEGHPALCPHLGIPGASQLHASPMEKSKCLHSGAPCPKEAQPTFRWQSWEATQGLCHPCAALHGLILVTLKVSPRAEAPRALTIPHGVPCVGPFRSPSQSTQSQQITLHKEEPPFCAAPVTALTQMHSAHSPIQPHAATCSLTRSLKRVPTGPSEAPLPRFPHGLSQVLPMGPT